MGLAASQARLLTITSRKSRAQYDSMRLSHERLALSRNLTDISNEYQNSLNQTKLYYDFYGINSTDTPLTYKLMMTPSSINDYIPTLLSDNQRHIVLSSPYASAARAAGIPQEGLGCTPSSLVREAFILGLVASNVITQGTADAILAVSYNPRAGLGSDTMVTEVTETGDVHMLMDYLSGMSITDLCGGKTVQSVGTTVTGMTGSCCGVDGQVYDEGPGSMDLNHWYAGQVIRAKGENGQGTNYYNYQGAGGTTTNDSEWDYGLWGGGYTDAFYADNITLADLLSTDDKYYFQVECNCNDIAEAWYGNYNNLVQATHIVIEALANGLTNLMGSDPKVLDAISYANMQMDEECWESAAKPSTGKSNRGRGFSQFFGGNRYVTEEKNGFTWSEHSGYGREYNGGQAHTRDASTQITNDYLAFGNCYRSRKALWCNKLESMGTISFSDFAKAWFTYFMQAMYGFGTPEAQQFEIHWQEKRENTKFATADKIEDYEFTFKTTYVSDNDALIANFYDTLFNQICLNGWVENNHVAEDGNYLKEMIQSGMMYITSLSDDYYFYQNNYATNSFIKEVTDDAAIAAAESRYTTEKARINAKEQELDLKMKNLDTEISSLETEYEAVKKIIENNTSKSFTRYDG